MIVIAMRFNLYLAKKTKKLKKEKKIRVLEIGRQDNLKIY
jgi:hypothetical protein